jgi:hypothetical protein
MKAAEAICRTLETLGAPYALIGAHAIGVRGYPRMTVDYDFLTSDPRVLRREVWQELVDHGASVDPRKGDLDDPLAGVVHILLADGTEVDVIVAKWKWEGAVIDRAERLDLGGIEVPVPHTSDLILLKLAAGGGIDLQDVLVLLGVGDREQLIPEVERHLSELDADARAAWERVKAESERPR